MLFATSLRAGIDVRFTIEGTTWTEMALDFFGSNENPERLGSSNVYSPGQEWASISYWYGHPL
jgi:hypothetical protein